MHPIQYALDCHEQLKRHKEHVWYHHGGNDMPPQLGIRWRDMNMQAINLARVMAGLGQHLPEHIRAELTRPPRVLDGLMELIADGNYPPEVHPPPTKDHPIEMMMLGLEGYQGRQEVDPQATEAEVRAQIETAKRTIHPGDLEHEYLTNPDSGVHEVLISYVVETGPLGLPEWSRLSSVVHKQDGGRLTWDEPLITTSEQTNHGGHDHLLTIMSRYVRRETLT